MVDVREDYEQFRAAGGDVVVITMGSPAQVASFKQRLNLPFPCLSDMSKAAYEAFEVPTGTIGQVAGPAIWKAGVKALVRGGIGIPRGDPYQLHGAFVVDSAGIVRFAHRPLHSADLPNHADMIATIQGVK